MERACGLTAGRHEQSTETARDPPLHRVVPFIDDPLLAIVAQSERLSRGVGVVRTALAALALSQRPPQPGHLQEITGAVQTLTGRLDVRLRALDELPRCGGETPALLPHAT
jgi:hypothetical protein